MQVIDYSPGNMAQVGKARGWFSEDQLCFIKYSQSFFSFIDRSGNLDVGIPLKVLDPLLIGHTSKSFEEICQSRAEELIALNKPLVVYWSGGIDSTLVLISLLKANAPDITVVLTSKSINEYPFFYKNFIEGKLKTRRVRPSIFSDVDYNEVIVTGELGDQLMGSANIEDYVDKTNFDISAVHATSWKDHVLSKYDEQYLELISKLVNIAPFEIVSAYDYLWWVNIVGKWQHVIMRMSNNMPGIVGPYLQNVEHFYRSQEFQNWSFSEYNHRALKLGNDFRTYKFHMKDLIAQYTFDYDYCANKLKEGSLPTSQANPYLFCLEDGTRIQFGERSDNLDLYDKNFGDQYDYLFKGNQ